MWGVPYMMSIAEWGLLRQWVYTSTFLIVSRSMNAIWPGAVVQKKTGEPWSSYMDFEVRSKCPWTLNKGAVYLRATMFCDNMENVPLSERRNKALDLTHQSDTGRDISEERIDVWCKGDIVEKRRKRRACDLALRVFLGWLNRVQQAFKQRLH